MYYTYRKEWLFGMKILFVCTGNTCRSPMAAALMNKIATENDIDAVAESAGVFAVDGESASDEAIQAMKKYDVDLSDHKARQLTQEIVDNNDIILTMTDAHKMLLGLGSDDKVFTLAEYAGDAGDISDPFGGDVTEYEETALEIYDLLTEVAERIVDSNG